MNQTESVVIATRRERFASMMSPTEFHAWESLEAALQAWPGPGGGERDAWRRLALAKTDAERREAQEELRRIGIDPTTGERT